MPEDFMPARLIDFVLQRITIERLDRHHWLLTYPIFGLDNIVTEKVTKSQLLDGVRVFSCVLDRIERALKQPIPRKTRTVKKSRPGSN